jgi:hypothetical protein
MTAVFREIGQTEAAISEVLWLRRNRAVSAPEFKGFAGSNYPILA